MGSLISPIADHRGELVGQSWARSAATSNQTPPVEVMRTPSNAAVRYNGSNSPLVNEKLDMVVSQKNCTC